MKNSEKYEKAFSYFKLNYDYKMGGTQTVILPNGKQKFFDDKEYYSGRGAKYNKNINHDIIGNVKISRSEYSLFLKKIKEQEENFKKTLKGQQEKEIRINNAKIQGIYSINENGYIELSDNILNAKRLAKTLNIKTEDAELLNSTGKTYVFAKQINSNKTYRLYHPDLSCNNLSIHIEENKKDEIENFKKSRGSHGQFAKALGQTSHSNHFVC